MREPRNELVSLTAGTGAIKSDIAVVLGILRLG